MPGIPGMRRQPARQQQKKRKGGHGVSGNPAKRTTAPAAPAAPVAPSGSPFGLPAQPAEADLAKAMADFKLPADVQKLFDQGR